jgi:hypothetical protein
MSSTRQEELPHRTKRPAAPRFDLRSLTTKIKQSFNQWQPQSVLENLADVCLRKNLCTTELGWYEIPSLRPKPEAIDAAEQ